MKPIDLTAVIAVLVCVMGCPAGDPNDGCSDEAFPELRAEVVDVYACFLSRTTSEGLGLGFDETPTAEALSARYTRRLESPTLCPSDGFDACLEDMRALAADCDIEEADTLPLLEEVHLSACGPDAFEGNAEEDAPCESGFGECADGLRCGTTFVPEGGCATCIPDVQAAEGESCLGTPCQDGLACVFDLSFVDDAGNQGEFVCNAVLGEGDDCSGAGVRACGGGLECGAGFVCGPPGADGESCLGNLPFGGREDSCGTGLYCDDREAQPVCKPLDDEEAACSVLYQDDAITVTNCAAGLNCDDGLCFDRSPPPPPDPPPPVPVGEACSTEEGSAPCEGRSLCEVTDGVDGICTLPVEAGLGEECSRPFVGSSGPPCEPPLFCREGNRRCVELPLVGERCVDNRCAAGLSCVSGTCYDRNVPIPSGDPCTDATRFMCSAAHVCVLDGAEGRCTPEHELPICALAE